MSLTCQTWANYQRAEFESSHPAATASSGREDAKEYSYYLIMVLRTESVNKSSNKYISEGEGNHN
jgi:hypothetical protein